MDGFTMLFGIVIWFFAVIGMMSVWKKHNEKAAPRGPNDLPPAAAVAG